MKDILFILIAFALCNAQQTPKQVETVYDTIIIKATLDLAEHYRNKP
jgi:hypothetical protein